LNLEALIGQRVTGGCDDCAAHQSVTKQADGIYVFTVHHDDTCPWFKARTRVSRQGSADQ
jgi:hypothetical protein